MFLVISTKKIKKLASWLVPTLIVGTIVVMAIIRIAELRSKI